MLVSERIRTQLIRNASEPEKRFYSLLFDAFDGKISANEFYERTHPIPSEFTNNLWLWLSAVTRVFCETVESLRGKTDILEKRIERLENKSQSNSGTGRSM